MKAHLLPNETVKYKQKLKTLSNELIILMNLFIYLFDDQTNTRELWKLVYKVVETKTMSKLIS